MKLGKLLLAIAAAGMLAACSDEARPPGRHVVLILLDTARAERFGSYDPSRQTSPNLDALAARGAVFLNHFSQATDTRSALPRLLYSRHFTPPLFPLSARVPYSDPADLFRRHDAEAISLPAVMAAHGYHTAMISAHTWLKQGTPFAREFAETHDLSEELDLEPGFPHPRAEAVLDFTLDWLERHRERDLFLYLHLMDTHAPRYFEDDAAALFEGDAERWRGTAGHDLDTTDPLGSEERAVLDAIYDGSVRYTDRHLGRLFDRYRRWEALDRTLIALTSDHGEHLLERPGELGHGGPWYDRVARVPLIVSYPDRLHQSLRATATSELVDVAPTLLGLLDLRLPREKAFDGVDLLSAAAAGRTTAVGQQALRTGSFKVLFEDPDEVILAPEPPDPTTLRGRLYDLVSDPGETIDLWGDRPEWLAQGLDRYRERLMAPWARYRATRTDRQPESAFAIAARHFRTDRPIPTVAERSGPAARGGWILSDHWRDSYLQSLPGARPLGIEIEIPDGRYELTAALSGGCSMAVAGDEPRRLERATDARPAVYGEIEIRGRAFRATLAPTDRAAPCSLNYLGFRPDGAAAEDAERDERLRTLGYIN